MSGDWQVKAVPIGPLNAVEVLCPSDGLFERKFSGTASVGMQV